MMRTMICTANHTERRSVAPAEVGQILADDQNILWLDFVKPTAEDLQFLVGEFKFHPLAIEDATKRNQRPKVDTYDDFSLIVFYDIDYVDETNQIDEHELHIFLGKNYLVTLHDEPIDEIGEVAERFHRNLAQIERGVGVLLYSLLDTIVDHYFPVADRVRERIEELETMVFANIQRQGLQDIFALKRELTYLRRVIAPQRDVIAVLARRELPIVGEASAVYFQDLYEHVLRVTDGIDLARDLISGLLDSYLSLNANNLAVASNNLNQVMKLLTSYSIILMSVTLIASIYGMNFDNMPELHWHYGYFVALFAMLMLALILARFFKRKGWL